MPIGIRFRETMAGAFALGAATPEDGVAAGEAAGTRLAMHAVVDIADLDGFIADPRHRGGLTGTIDFPPLGTAISAGSGNFNLFSPTDDPAMKHMVYELAFEHDGSHRYLAGHKNVRDDPGFDMIADTTTLFITLHEGGDKDGSVIGAGILKLDMFDLARLVSTITVTGTDDAGEMAAAVARFGRFFLGELWDTYGI